MYKISYAFFLFLRFLHRFLGSRLFVIFSQAFAWLLYIAGLRRRVAQKNIQQAFPDYSPAFRRKILRLAYQHFCEYFRFCFLLQDLPLKNWLRNVEFKNDHLWQEDLKKGRGVVFLASHLGSFEIFGLLPAFYDCKVYALVDRVHNPYFQRWASKMRSRFGAQLLYKSPQLGLQMLKILHEGSVLIVANDLNYPDADLFLDFFGRPASIGTGAFRVALARKAPIWTGACFQTGPHQYCSTFSPIVRDYSSLDSSLTKQETVASFVKSYLTFLETNIRAHPTEYFWFNKRWKTNPPGYQGADFYA